MPVAVGGSVEGPAAVVAFDLVEEGVVAPAEQRPVVEGAAAAVGSPVEVVDVAPRRWGVASGEDAVLVADGDEASLGVGEVGGAGGGVDDGAGGVDVGLILAGGCDKTPRDVRGGRGSRPKGYSRIEADGRGRGVRSLGPGALGAW